MILSILVPCLEKRDYAKVVNELLRQAEEFDDVEVLMEVDNGELPSGAKRNKMMARCTGQYICHVDDDDWIEPDYVKLIREGCLTGKDVVTFNLDIFYRKYEIWRFALQPSSRVEGVMMVNHLCAWRRDIALRNAFPPEFGYSDDQLWFLPLFHAGLVKTEHHINKVLYHYIWRDGVNQPRVHTANQQWSKIYQTRDWAEKGIRCFMVDGEILVEVGGSQYFPDREIGANVRGRDLVVRFLPLSETVQPYYTITIK